MKTKLVLLLLIGFTGLSINAQTELIQNGDFSNLYTNWSTSGMWYISNSFSCYSSQSAYAYVGDASGGAVNNAYGNLYQTVIIPANTTSATLSYKVSINTDETSVSSTYDYIAVYLADLSLNPLTSATAYTYGNLQGSSGSTNCQAYQSHSFSIPSSLFGQTVFVVFHAYTDNAKWTKFRVDDVSLEATVSSCTAVSMSSQPSNQTITAGNTASYNVSVNGTAPFSYFWYKNGVFQVNTTNVSSASDTYTTPSVTSTDNGNYYYCLISNCSGTHEVKSDNANLTVTSTSAAPVANFVASGSTSISTGGTVLFTNLSTGNPTTTYSWSVSPTSGVTFSPNNTSTSPTITFNDAGTYDITLTATNSNSSNTKVIEKYITVNSGSTYSISGTVNDAYVNEINGKIDFNPLSNCAVSLYSQGTRNTIQTFTTTSTGIFIFNGLASGNYDLEIDYLGTKNFSIKKFNISSGTNVGDIVISNSINKQIDFLITDLVNLKCYLTEINKTLDIQSYNMTSVQNLLSQWQNQSSDYDNKLNSASRLFLFNKELLAFYTNAAYMNDENISNILALSEALFEYLTISAKLQQLINNSSFPYGYDLMKDLIDNTESVFLGMVNTMTALMPSPYGQEFSARIQEAFLIVENNPLNLVVGFAKEPISKKMTNYYLGDNYVNSTQNLVNYTTNNASSFNYTGPFNNAFNKVNSDINNCENKIQTDIFNCIFYRNLSMISQLLSSLSQAGALISGATGAGAGVAATLETVTTVTNLVSLTSIGFSEYYSLHRLYKIQEDLSFSVSHSFMKSAKNFNIFNSTNFLSSTQSIKARTTDNNSLLKEIINDVNSGNKRLAIIKTIKWYSLDSILQNSINESFNFINAAAPLADQLDSNFAIQYYRNLGNVQSTAPINKLSFYYSMVAYMIDSTNNNVINNINIYGNNLINANSQLPIELNNIYNIVSSIPSPAYIVPIYNSIPKFLNASASQKVTVKFKNYGSTDANNLYVKIKLDNAFSISIDSIYVGTMKVNSIDSISFNIKSQKADTLGFYRITFNSINSLSKPLVGIISTKLITYKIVTNSFDDELIVYPNPTNGKFQIEVFNEKGLEIKIYNDLEEIIYQSLINNSKSEIDISNKPKGIYFLQVKLNGKAFNRKIVLQ